MKFIHTFGTAKRADGKSFISTDDIVSYKIEIVAKSDKHKDVPVECICYTHDYCKYVLTPTRPINTKEDIALLQQFIVELLKVIATTPDGSIIRCYSEDEKEWSILADIGGGL